MLSVAIYLRPDDRDQSLLETQDWQDYTRFGFEIGTICGVLSYIIVQQGGEIKNQGFLSFLKQLVSIFYYLSYYIKNTHATECYLIVSQFPYVCDEWWPAIIYV